MIPNGVGARPELEGERTFEERCHETQLTFLRWRAE